jgi:hypothetical protein
MTQAGLAATPSPEAEPPIEMLEFLGTWQTPDGKDINPFELDDATDLPSADLRPQISPADSSRKETLQNSTGRKSSRQQDRLPEAPKR